MGSQQRSERWKICVKIRDKKGRKGARGGEGGEWGRIKEAGELKWEGNAVA